MKITRVGLLASAVLPIAPFLVPPNASAEESAGDTFPDDVSEEFVGSLIIDGETISYTDLDRQAVQSARERYGLDGGAARIEDLARLLERGDAEYFRGAILTIEEFRAVEAQIKHELVASTLDLELRGKLDYGGLWIDHTRGGQITVAVTDNEGATAIRAREIFASGEAPITVRLVTNTESVLVTVQEHMFRVSEARGIDVVISVMLRSNSVEVMGAPEDLASFKTVMETDGQLTNFPGVPVDYVLGTPVVESVNLHGGQLVSVFEDGIAQSKCTLGPTLVASGVRYTTTAGHCDPPGGFVSDYRIGGTKVGWTNVASNTGTVDAALVNVSGGHSTTDDVWWLAGTTANTKDVVGNWNAVVGADICETQGRSNTSRCGPVTSINASGATNTGQIRATMCERPGDSGSPGFRDNNDGTVSISGIHQAGTGNGFICTATDIVLLSKISAINTLFSTTTATS